MVSVHCMTYNPVTDSPDQYLPARRALGIFPVRARQVSSIDETNASVFSRFVSPLQILRRSLNDRSLIRFRKTLTQDMGRFKTQIKSFLYFFGIELPDEFKDPNKHWTKRFMSWLEEIQMKEQSGKQALMALVRIARKMWREDDHI